MANRLSVQYQQNSDQYRRQNRQPADHNHPLHGNLPNGRVKSRYFVVGLHFTIKISTTEIIPIRIIGVAGKRIQYRLRRNCRGRPKSLQITSVYVPIRMSEYEFAQVHKVARTPVGRLFPMQNAFDLLLKIPGMTYHTLIIVYFRQLSFASKYVTQAL